MNKQPVQQRHSDVTRGVRMLDRWILSDIDDRRRGDVTDKFEVPWGVKHIQHDGQKIINEVARLSIGGTL